jgi:hypothetical protein
MYHKANILTDSKNNQIKMNGRVQEEDGGRKEVGGGDSKVSLIAHDLL